MALSKEQHALLKALHRHKGNVSRACIASNVGRTTHYDWVNGNPEYAQAYEEILQEIKDDLESMLLERAEVSDTVLIFLSKTRLRDRGYNERDELTVKHEHTDEVRVRIDFSE